MARHVLCKVDDIPPRTGQLVRAAGRDLAVFNLGERFAAIANRCPHEGADLCRGKVAAFASATAPGEYTVDQDRIMVRCPWHGWEFDLNTGQSYCDPKRMRVKSFDVSVSDGATLAEGPYEVEVFEVTTDGRYVVLDI